MRVNLNKNIKVKLTDYGKDIFYHRYDELNEARGRICITPRYPEVDADGYTRFQLWDFMNIYGQYMAFGNQKNVICPLEIVVEG